jgi:putative colanic acid biosynthesis glycosyltransferase WcaI
LKLLLLNQCFWPDVVSTAQHLTDLASELAAGGHDVTVVTGDRGYDDPARRFPRSEQWRGIRIIRIGALSFGKGTRLRRALNFGSFLLNCSLRLLLLPGFDVVIALTSPPLISFLGALFVKLRGGRFLFWVMDLNPDEAIAAGWLSKSSLPARVLENLLRYSLRQAEAVVVLDRFMQQRILEKGIREDCIAVLPPWAHDDFVCYDERGREEFRRRHGLQEKFVVMYSGNHSPCHPLDTLLKAALELGQRRDIAFCFVGGGSEQNRVRAYAEQHGLDQIKCLPYQPLESLAGSLSAADLHVVVMGNPFVGIVHPCKIYNILAIGASLLYIGPPESHVSDLLNDLNGRARTSGHGEVELVVRHIVAAADSSDGNRSRSQAASASRFSKRTLLPQMVKIVLAGKDGKVSGVHALADSLTVPQ